MLIFIVVWKFNGKYSEVCSNTESALKKTAQLHKALAKIEATLSRKKNQKVTERSQKVSLSLSRRFKPLNLIYVFWKPPINEYRDWISIMLLPKPVRPVDSEKKGKVE